MPGNWRLISMHVICFMGQACCKYSGKVQQEQTSKWIKVNVKGSVEILGGCCSWGVNCLGWSTGIPDPSVLLEDKPSTDFHNYRQYICQSLCRYMWHSLSKWLNVIWDPWHSPHHCTQHSSHFQQCGVYCLSELMRQETLNLTETSQWMPQLLYHR